MSTPEPWEAGEAPLPQAISLDQQAFFDANVVDPSSAAPGLADAFGVPPFSVLDTRQGYWIERKREWLALGIRSEIGRGEVMPSGATSVYLGTPPDGSPMRGKNGSVKLREANAIPGGSRWPSPQLTADGKIQRGGVAGRAFQQDVLRGEADVRLTAKGQPEEGWTAETDAPGTSIFDPVLCELAYSWYSPPGGYILDPFAGGSVRGIIAAYCERYYDGVDLRPEQVAANEQQWAQISAAHPPRAEIASSWADYAPAWHCADSRDIAQLDLPQADLLFTCPPYYDLEIYSDDPGDLSRADSYDAFLDAYRHILKAAVARLAPDRYACLVVSEIRDPKTGCYRGFVPDTISAMRDAGCDYYNEAALINRAGSLPLRAGKQFSAGRKLGRSHQAVLTFVKGDGRRAADACGPVALIDYGGGA